MREKKEEEERGKKRREKTEKVHGERSESIEWTRMCV